MFTSRLLSMSLLASLIAAPAFAQTGTPVTPGTNAADQQQIEDGLKSGNLSAGEASKLEREQQTLDREESKGASETQLENQQNKFENSVNKLDGNAVQGNPNSVNDQRMQKDVQRNINQQNRINNGVNSGKLTAGEEQKLERGQAHVNRAEANSHGKMTRVRQEKIEDKENRQNRRIHHKKHNENNAPAAAPVTAPAN